MFPTNKPVLVTCGLPYANGPCHIGHLRTYVPADIFVRTLRKLGQEVVFVCGSDAHGTPIIMNAESLGTTPRELVDKYHEHFNQTFKTLWVEFDNYGRTDSLMNHHRTQDIVITLIDRGYVYPKVVELAYCSNCKQVLPDRYVEGICPYCEEIARGDECDQGCGRHLEPGEIQNPVCKRCGSKAEFQEQEHYFFRLSSFQDFLKEYLETLQGTSNARNYAREWVNRELKDWCITRNLEWGVPFPDDESLVVYVWVDAPIGYISSTEGWAIENSESYEKYWKRDSMIIHFIGSDIIYHHCIFWPALLKGADYTLPEAVVASGMVKIEDKTFSKSRGYVVWVNDDYLDQGFHPDLLRYYLASYTSHTKELNFSWQVFQERVNNELVAILGNLAYRVLLFTHKNFESIPEGELEEEVTQKIQGTSEAIIDALGEYEFKKLVDSAMALANFGNTYFQSNEPWKLIDTDRERCGVVLKNCLQIIKALAVFLEPVMPTKMETLWYQLGVKGDIHEALIDEALTELKSDYTLSQPELLFGKIDDERITEMDERLHERIKTASEAAARGGVQTVEDGSTVSFDEFQKLDLRVGEILEVESIEGSDKLIKMLVDLGEEEPRTLVAGIAQLHSSDDLVGKQIVVLANLEPTTFFGVESHGMLLAAGDDAVLIAPGEKVEPGMRIR